MTQSPRDIAIMGGGLAGLSLAVQLVRHAVPARVVIIDPRTSYTDDRTWCFWDVLDHPFREAISHRWHRWRVATSAGTATAGSQELPYCRLPSGAFYDAAWATLEAADHVTLALGHSVNAIQTSGERLAIDTNGDTIEADIAFDARPPEAESWQADDRPFLWQTFEGWRVRTASANWNSDTVDLMDFTDSPCEDATGFLYTLPLTEHDALVESTAFLPATSGTTADHRHHIERALRARLGDTGYTVEAREQGRIPMTTAQPPRHTDPRIVAIGTRAGAPRPSSGYAFLPIQRHSRGLAAQLARGQWPAAKVRGRGTEWLDGVFLRRLCRQPEAAPELFRRLFERVDSNRLVRFLTETGSVSDHLAVMSALPWAPFAAEAVVGPFRTLPMRG